MRTRVKAIKCSLIRPALFILGPRAGVVMLLCPYRASVTSDHVRPFLNSCTPFVSKLRFATHSRPSPSILGTLLPSSICVDVLPPTRAPSLPRQGPSRLQLRLARYRAVHLPLHPRRMHRLACGYLPAARHLPPPLLLHLPGVHHLARHQLRPASDDQRRLVRRALRGMHRLAGGQLFTRRGGGGGAVCGGGVYE